MLGTGVIIEGLKKALNVGKAFVRSPMKVGGALMKRATNQFTKQNLKWVVSIGRSNAKAAIWMRRGVKLLRTKKSFLGMIGQLGTQLKGASGGLGWLGKGLSAFDIDFRSPKQFRKDQIAQEESLSMMRLKRAQLQKKSDAVQKELNEPPVDLSGHATSEAKLDALGNHITSMKNNIGEVKHTAKSTEAAIRGFEDYQTKTNEALSEAISVNSQNTMKATISAINESEEKNTAVTADATSTIISSISGKIDAIEDAKQAAEEERRKNDWKRKFFGKLIWALDWILNWPTKLAMMAAALLAGILTFVIVKYWQPLKTFMSMSFGTGVKQILLRLTQAVGWILEKILGAIADLGKWLSGAIYGSIANIFEKLSALPLPGIDKLMAKGVAWAFDKADKAAKWMNDFVFGNLSKMMRDMKESAKNYADADMEKQKEKVEGQEMAKAAMEGLNGQYATFSVSDALSGKATPKEEDKDKKGDHVPSGRSVGENIAKIGIDNVLNPLANALGDKRVEQAIDPMMKKGKEAAKIISVKLDELAEDGTKAAVEGLNTAGEVSKSVEPKLDEVNDKLNAALLGLDKLASQNGGQTQVKEGDTFNFESSSEQYQNQIQNT